MYEKSNSTRIEEKIQNAELVKNLFEEKNKFEQKYTSLVDDVNKFMETTTRRAMEENMAKLKGDCEDQSKIELGRIERERDQLKEEKKKWEEEKKALKDEKKKLEYMLFDLLKSSEASKEKIKAIKQICEE